MTLHRTACRLHLALSASALVACAGLAAAQGRSEVTPNPPAAATQSPIPAQRAGGRDATREGAALGIGLALGALARGAAASPPMAQGDETLRESNRALNAQNLQLRRTIEALNARIVALGAADAAASSAQQREQAQNFKAARDATQLQAVNRTLQGQASDLSKEVETLREQVATATSRLNEANQALSRSKSEHAKTAQDLEAANQRIADRDQEAQRQRSELAATSTRTRQIEDETHRLQAALAAAQRERWTWAALFAMLAAGLATAAVRLWWPKSIHLTKPWSVSVGLGAWNLEASPLASAPAATFQVRTQWLPGGSLVRTAGELVPRPTLVVIHGEAA